MLITRALLLSALGWLITISGPAQTVQEAEEPEFADVFMRLKAGKLIPLERESGTGVVSTVFSVKFSTMLPLGKSPVRFRSSESLEFVVKASALFAFGSGDPGSIYGLRRLTAKKDHREFVTSALGYGGLLGAKMKEVAHLPLDFAHYGDESIKITVVGKLPRGEYALARMGPLVSPLGHQSLFCFGVD
jgi:hypothetical protein